MTGLEVVADCTRDPLPGPSPEWTGEVTAIGVIPNGTAGGRAAVAVKIALGDGTTVVGQTTLALLAVGVKALADRYPAEPPR